MIYLLYVLALVALGVVIVIAYSYGFKRGARLTATAMENGIAHVAPDLYPELARRVASHQENPDAFHAAQKVQSITGNQQAN